MISIKAPAIQSGSYLFVIAQEGNVQVIVPIVEKEAQGDVPAAFKSAFRELADAQSAVKVRLSKVLGQLAEGQQAFDSLVLRQMGKAP